MPHMGPALYCLPATRLAPASHCSKRRASWGHGPAHNKRCARRMHVQQLTLVTTQATPGVSTCPGAGHSNPLARQGKTGRTILTSPSPHTHMPSCRSVVPGGCAPHNQPSKASAVTFQCVYHSCTALCGCPCGQEDILAVLTPERRTSQPPSTAAHTAATLPGVWSSLGGVTAHGWRWCARWAQRPTVQGRSAAHLYSRHQACTYPQPPCSPPCADGGKHDCMAAVKDRPCLRNRPHRKACG